MSGCLPVAGLRCLTRDSRMAAQGTPRFLLTFDFHETIVDRNSDDSTVRTAPDQQLPESPRPPTARASTTSTGSASSSSWVSRACGRGTCALSTRPSPCLRAWETCCSLWSSRAPASRLFSSRMPTPLVWRAPCAAGHHGLFRRVLSNPSGPDAWGLLALRPFHTHSCTRCPANMCKHKVLSDFLRQRAHDGVHFEHLFYVGDGANDFCPMGMLAAGDVAFPRRGYPMHRLIQEAQMAEPSSFRASVVPWETATDVRLHLQQVLKTC